MNVQCEQNYDRPFTRLYNQMFLAQGAPASSGLHQPGAAGSRGGHDAMPKMPVPRAEYRLSARASTAADLAQSNQVQGRACFGRHGRGTTPIIQPLAAGANWDACMQNIDNAGLEILLALNARPGPFQNPYSSTVI